MSPGWRRLSFDSGDEHGACGTRLDEMEFVLGRAPHFADGIFFQSTNFTADVVNIRLWRAGALGLTKKDTQ
jgi:hypothetical protein